MDEVKTSVVDMNQMFYKLPEATTGPWEPSADCFQPGQDSALRLITNANVHFLL